VFLEGESHAVKRGYVHNKATLDHGDCRADSKGKSYTLMIVTHT
jgi:hypothetical protein